ncbi:DUF1566 domain-containing protein [Algibacter sp.]|nr:DUF1566 domain-containing protein [Algibacter sp.]MDC1276767.1 DUF1566 domain-containing protein [Algibacter sp.]
MKKLYTILAAILLTATTFAQAPEKMSYQAVVRDGGDVLVTNQVVGMQISILQGSETGTSVYTETQTPTTNINGLVTLEIGKGTTIDIFSDIDWSTGTYFIKTETDPIGGSSYTITGTSQLLSVPYALHAKTVESVTSTCGLSIGDTYQGGIIFYLDASGCHGLIAAPGDQSTGIRWYAGTFGLAQAKGDGIYAGKANTSIIIAAQVAIGDDGDNYAARLCNELQIIEGGTTYGDWYLPSKYELNLMYENIGLGNALGLGNVGNFPGNPYWSSTEYDNNLAWGQSFGFGGQKFYGFKDYTYRVRAVRAF